MPKPASVPTWATDTNYPASSQPWASTPTKVQPSSGQQARGWEPEDPPPAQYFNWWKNLAGAWIAWYNGTRIRHIPAASGVQTAGTAMTWDASTDDAIKTSATNNVFRIPIMMQEGERLLQVDCKVQTLAAGDTVSMVIKRTEIVSGAPVTTTLGSAATTSSPPSTVTLSSGAISNEDVGTTFVTYYAEFTVGAFSSGARIGGLLVSNSIP